jgi:hypothetical protein
MVKKIVFPETADQKAIERLKDLMQEYPADNDLLRWAYVLFTYPEREGLFLRKKTEEFSLAHEGITWKNFMTLPASGIRSFAEVVGQIDRFAGKIIQNNNEMDDRGSEQYKKWAAEYKKRISSGFYSSGPASNFNRSESFFRLHSYVSGSEPSEDVYHQHQHMVYLQRYYERTSIDHVMDVINGRAGSRNKRKFQAAQAKMQSPNDVKIPACGASERQGILQKAESLKPLSFEQISGFGVDVENSAGQAMAQLSSYFLYNATRAAETLDCIEASLEEIQKADPQALVQSDPTGWWQRQITRVRLVEPDKMPLMRLVEQFSELPERANVDNAAYATDLEIVDHAIKVCGAYHNLISAHRTALESQKERLLQADKTSCLPLDVATAGIPALIEHRLASLTTNAQIMVVQAANFGSIGTAIGTARSRLGKTSSMAATIQLPALDAIRQFHLYQIRRMGLLGQKVGDTIIEGFEINEHTIGSAEKATPERTREILAESFKALAGDIRQMQEGVLEDIEAQKRLADDIRQKTLQASMNEGDVLSLVR